MLEFLKSNFRKKLNNNVDCGLISLLKIYIYFLGGLCFVSTDFCLLAEKDSYRFPGQNVQDVSPTTTLLCRWDTTDLRDTWIQCSINHWKRA